MTDVDGIWRNQAWDYATKDIWTMTVGPLYRVEMTRGGVSGCSGLFWRAHVNGRFVAHGNLEKAKAKVDWLLWNDLRCSADAYRRIRERVKAPGFPYDGSW
jgi:hypothetical protein